MDDISLDAKMFKPETLSEAIGLARLEDEWLAAKKKQTRRGVPPSSGASIHGSH